MKRVVLVAALFLASAAVAEAHEYTLSALGQGYWINGAFYTTTEQRPMGTGYIQPFLKFTTNQPQTQAYNYDRAMYGDVAGNTSYGSANWTELLETGNLAITTMPDANGVMTDYWKFVLDIDQAKGKGTYFSLDYLTFSTSNDATYHGAITGTGTPGVLPTFPYLGTQFYTLSPDCVLFCYSLNAGSGGGDLYVYVPVPDTYGKYLYLASALGYKGKGYYNSGGPEEWAAEQKAVVPDGGSMAMLLGVALFGLAGLRRILK